MKVIEVRLSIMKVIEVRLSIMKVIEVRLSIRLVGVFPYFSVVYRRKIFLSWYFSSYFKLF